MQCNLTGGRNTVLEVSNNEKSVLIQFIELQILSSSDKKVGYCQTVNRDGVMMMMSIIIIFFFFSFFKYWKGVTAAFM